MTTVFKTSEKSMVYRIPSFSPFVKNPDGTDNKELMSDLILFSSKVIPRDTYAEWHVNQWIKARGYIELPPEETEEDKWIESEHKKGHLVLF